MIKLIPTEHDEAVILAQYLELLKTQGKIELFSHIPNETFTRNWGTKRKNKMEGVKKGVPDYIIITKNIVLFIELKRTKGSITSSEQKEWISRLTDKKTRAFTAKGFEQARWIIEGYL